MILTQEATIATTYIGSGTEEDPYRPALFDLLQKGESAEDVTGTPADQITGKPAVIVRMRAKEARIDTIDSVEHKVLSRRDVVEDLNLELS